MHTLGWKVTEAEWGCVCVCGGADCIFDMTPCRVRLKGERLCLFRN